MLGLDIQATFMRLLQIKNTRQGWLVEKMVESKLPVDIACEGKITRWDILEEVLANWIAELGVAGMPVAIHIPSQLVHRQRLSVPEGFSTQEIMAEIRVKMQRDLPGMQDELSIDFSEMSTTNKNEREVMFAVCRREYLLRYQQCIEASGLRVKIIDVDAYALLRAITADEILADQESVFFLHLTPESATLSVFHRQELMFYQSWYSAQDCLLQLSSTLERCQAIAPTLMFDKLLVVAPDFLTNCLMQDPIWHGQIVCINPFVSLSFAKSIDLAFANLSGYLIALGLAMREVPVW